MDFNKNLSNCKDFLKMKSEVDNEYLRANILSVFLKDENSIGFLVLCFNDPRLEKQKI